MMPTRLARQLVLAAGATALLGMGMLTACGTKEKPAENAPSSNPTATAPVSPTEKSVSGAITPGKRSGPPVTDRPAPTASPGNIIPGG